MDQLGSNVERGRAGGQALIVEDDPLLLELLSDVAAAAGLEPVRCRSLSAARDALAGPVPAVAMVDDDLPDGTGADLVRELKSNQRLRGVRVLFCTSAEPQRRREIGRMAPVIRKPFALREVERVMREAARH